MTQQDETEHSAAMHGPALSRPSPYLEGGESVPEAYLAPPQPGKPAYGAPQAYRPGLRTGGSPPLPHSQPDHGQPGYRQPGYRQPGYRQPGYRQPGYRQLGYSKAGGRSRAGMQARRDPALAAPWERLVASLLDWIIIFVIAMLAFWSPMTRLLREWQAITTSYQDPNSPAAQAAINSLFRDPANEHTLLYWFLGMFGIALAYYWVQHAAWGATIGKRALGVQVVLAGDRSRIGVRAAGIRAAAFLVGPAAFLILVTSPINLAGGVLWVADTGLVLLDPRAQCLHDKLAGTIVIRRRWLARQARSDRPW